MVGARKQEPHSRSNRAEAPDDQPLRTEGVQNGVFREMLGPGGVVVINWQ